MATLTETETWVEGIYQLEEEDLVKGGADGIDNVQAKQLANRTTYLKALVESLGTDKQDAAVTLAALATLIGSANRLPYFTGTDSVALTGFTAFARSLVAASDAAAARTVLGAATPADITAAITALVNASPAALDTLNELATALGNDPNFATTVTNAIAAKAPLASPALTGTPTAPTPAQFDNDTSLATTAFVQGELGNYGGVVGINATQALTNLHIGKLLEVGTAGVVLTLPEAGAHVGKTIVIFNASLGAITIAAGNINSAYDSGVSVAMPIGATAIFVADGTSWSAIGGSMASGSRYGSFLSTVQYNASATLTAKDVGKLVISGAGGGVFTLPLLSMVPAGSKINIVMQGGTSSVVPQGSDVLYLTNATTPSITLIGGEWIEITSSGGGWMVTGGATLSSIGCGQAWQNVTASRAIGTTYTNATRKPIQVNATVYSSTVSANFGVNAYVGGVIVASSGSRVTAESGNNLAFISFIVPVGASYSLSSSGTVALSLWSELR